MRMLHHGLNLSADQVLPLLFLTPSPLPVHFPPRLVKLFQSVHPATTHVHHSVNLPIQATSQHLFVKVNGMSPESQGLTGYCRRRIAVDAQPTERRIGGKAKLKKPVHFCLILRSAHLVAGQINQKPEPANVDHNIPSLIIFLEVENPGEVRSDLFAGLPTVAHSRSIGRRFPKDQTSFSMDYVKCDVKWMPLMPLAPLGPSKKLHLCALVPKTYPLVGSLGFCLKVSRR